MKSFKEILREQEGRKQFRDLLKTKQIDIKIEQQPSSQQTPSYQGKAARRAAKVNVSQQKPTAARVADTALTPKQQQAQAKGYRTPEGNISQRGVETYATRRGAMGYGDPGKDPSKYGVDPRKAAEAARERTRTASQGVGAERRAARRGIKIDVAKIERNYPSPKPATGSQSGFSQFSRKASGITSDIKTGRANISTPEMSAKDAKFFKSLEPDPVKRTAAKIDAAIGQQADDLMGKKGPQAPTGYRQQGLKDLSKAIDDLDTPSSKPQVKPSQPAPAPKVRRGQGARAAGSTTTRGGAPQTGTRQTAAMLDALRDMSDDAAKASKPKGAARVTYGQGSAPSSSFKAFSQQATTAAAKPGSTGSTSAATSQIDKARRLATPMGRAARVGGIARGIASKATLPVTAGIEGAAEILAPEKQASVPRTVIKKGAQLAAASKGAQLGAKIGSLGGSWGRAIGGLVGGGIGYATAGSGFETVAGQTPTEKKAAAKLNRDVQQMQKPSTDAGSFGTRPLQTVVKDPTTGKETVGYLTKQNYQGQEFTGYKAADTSNAARAASTSNWLERIGRTVNPKAYEKSDEEAIKKRVARIKKIQGLPEGRVPMKTYAQFMEQTRRPYQQSPTSQTTQSGTETFLRVSDYLADLAARGIGKATDFTGSALSGVVKGFTGGRVDPERIGYEGEKFINKVGRTVRKAEQGIVKAGSKLSPSMLMRTY